MKKLAMISIALSGVLVLSLTFSAHAANQGKIDIPMVSIPGKNYEIGKTEVTQGQWLAVMGENPSVNSKCGEDCPVENVSWDDAIRFIKRLNRTSGKEYRLPTEVEWKYACLAGSNTTYCGGENVDKLGWYQDNSGGEISPVAGKNPNAWGLYDMSGNVWEWCQDRFADDDEAHVLHGGGWNNPAKRLSADERTHEDKNDRRMVGFRLARTLP